MTTTKTETKTKEVDQTTIELRAIRSIENTMKKLQGQARSRVFRYVGAKIEEEERQAWEKSQIAARSVHGPSSIDHPVTGPRFPN